MVWLGKIFLNSNFLIQVVFIQISNTLNTQQLEWVKQIFLKFHLGR